MWQLPQKSSSKPTLLLSLFSDNKNLQNLLLLAATHANKGKGVGCISQLKTDSEIAKVPMDLSLFETPMIYEEYD